LPSIAACDVWCDMSRVEEEVRDLGVQDGKRAYKGKVRKRDIHYAFHIKTQGVGTGLQE
jgi:hypothetical protein